MTPQVPAPKADPRHAVVVRDLLRRTGYSREGIQAVLGVGGDVLARPQERPVYLRRLGGPSPLATLARLFLIDTPVDASEAERELGPAATESLNALGLIRADHGMVQGLVRMVPHGEIVVASDLPDREGVHPDHVAGLHRPSITLADLTIRRPVRRALDVGTGCGIQAMLAARHSQRVVATDINARALAFAALNAALNGIENIEFRHGSFFEPVAGETFGLVVCNPPYVISPETAYVFRDSGLGRDRVSERLVGELPHFLDDGGFGTIMVSWIQSGTDLTERPGGWLEGAGCDAWILHTALEDPLTTAAGWNRDLAPDEERYAQAVDRWTGYFRDEGIEALAYGSIVMRKRASGGNWIRTRELPNEPRVHPEEHLLRLFTGPDFSSAHPDVDDLAAERIALASGVTLTTRLRLDPDGWSEASDLRLDRGLPFSAEVDRFTASFLAQLDGSRSLGEILDEFALAHDAAPERVRAGGVRVVRELLELGFAQPPVGDSSETDS